MSLIDSLLHIVAPHYCLGCGAEGSLLCLGCSAQLQDSDYLPALNPAQALSGVYAATLYEDVAKNLVWRVKYHGTQAAAKQMTRLMKLALPCQAEFSYIVPVPTASKRARQRGYDQAVLLARELSRLTSVPFLNCLMRLGQAHQVGASRSERLRQLREAFRAKPSIQLQGAHILLVDDVITTGATLEAAAAALKESGAAQVSAAVFAQA